MPGRDYNRAFAAFEQTLGEPSDLAASKGSFRISRASRARSAQELSPVRTHPPPPLVEFSRSTEADVLPIQRPSSEGKGLPVQRSLDLGLAPKRASSARKSYGPRINTPSTSYSPPTPNTSPPSLVHNLTPDPSDLSKSVPSRSDSFATAKEEQRWSQSEAVSPIDLPLQGVKQATSHNSGGLRNLGWGIENLGQDDDTIVLNRPDTVVAPVFPEMEPMEPVWSSILAEGQNVSGQSQHELGPYPAVTFLEDDALPAEDFADHASNQSSWLECSSVEQLNLIKNDSPKMSTKSNKNRLSQASGTSTVVQASTRGNSPNEPRRRLRHVSKASSLREHASNSPPQTQGSPSDGSVKRKLTHKKGRILNRQPDLEADLHHRAKRSSGNSERPTSFMSWSQSPDSSTKSRHRLSGTDEYWTRPRPISEPLFTGFIVSYDEPNEGPQRSHTVGNRAADATSKTAERRHRTSDPFRRSSRRESPQHSRKSSRTESPASIKPMRKRPKGIIYDPPKELQHLLSGRTSGDDAPQKSPGSHLEVATAPRSDLKTSPMSMKSENTEALVSEATAINIYPHNNDSLLVIQHPSPPSSRSKPTSSSQEQRSDRNRDSFPSAGAASPSIRAQKARTVYSPLQNPRKPPRPPTFSVTPPSPLPSYGPEAAEGPIPEAVPRSKPPSRRDSLIKQARRVSDSLWSPVASLKTNSNRNSWRRFSFIANKRDKFDEQDPQPLQSNPLRAPTFGEGSLSPEWQPRQFWNDTSEAEGSLGQFASSSRDDGPALAPTVSGYPTRTTMRDSAGETSRKSSRAASIKRIFSRKKKESDSRTPSGSNRVSSSNLSSPPLTQHTQQQPGMSNVTLRDSLRRTSGKNSVSNSNRNSWAGAGLQGLREKLHDRSIRREESQRQGQRDRLRNSIGPRIYVEPGSVSGPPRED